MSDEGVNRYTFYKRANPESVHTMCQTLEGYLQKIARLAQASNPSGENPDLTTATSVLQTCVNKLNEQLQEEATFKPASF